MTDKSKAKQLVDLLGRENAIVISNEIFLEHYNYSDPYTVWRTKGENYTNKEKCTYWNNVRIEIENNPEFKK
jgi:hypothetical protein